MPGERQILNLDNMVYVTQEDFTTRVGAEPPRAHYTISEAIDNLRYKFENLKTTLFATVDGLVEKMRECARTNDLVDEHGGPLMNSSKNSNCKRLPQKEVMNKNEC